MVRLRWNAIGLAIALIGCTKRNPNVCCETDAECMAVGYDSPQPCELGVCVANACEEVGCDGDEDCPEMTPRCGANVCESIASTCESAGGRVVYVSNRDGDDDLIVANADGYGAHPITTTIANERDPRWSPDGRRVAFTRDGLGGGRDLFVANVDGTGAVNLTSSSSRETFAEWSGDSVNLAFETEAPPYKAAWLVNATSGAPRQIDTMSTDSAHPSWGPDSARYAFSAKAAVGEPARLIVILIDGTGRNPFSVAAAGQGDLHPRWSPDGAKIAFTSDRGGAGALWIVDANGTNPVQLVADVPIDSTPAWAPDSLRIAFVRQQGPQRNVWSVKRDGSDERNLTQHDSFNDRPRWSPNGLYLLFNSTRDGNSEVYRMRNDGTETRNLSSDPATDSDADWIGCGN